MTLRHDTKILGALTQFIFVICGDYDNQKIGSCDFIFNSFLKTFKYSIQIKLYCINK